MQGSEAEAWIEVAYLSIFCGWAIQAEQPAGAGGDGAFGQQVEAGVFDLAAKDAAAHEPVFDEDFSLGAGAPEAGDEAVVGEAIGEAADERDPSTGSGTQGAGPEFGLREAMGPGRKEARGAANRVPRLASL